MISKNRLVRELELYFRMYKLGTYYKEVYYINSINEAITKLKKRVLNPQGITYKVIKY